MMSDESSLRIEATDDGSQSLHLTGDIDVFLAARLHQEVTHLAALCRDVHVHCGAVRSVDVSILQILVALRNALAERGRTLQLRDASEGLRETLRLAGLAQTLSH